MIPVPIINFIDMDCSGEALVFALNDLIGSCVKYRMVDGDPTRLEPVG